MAATFRCTIITPTEAFFEADVTYVSLPSWDGQMGVMAGRSPALVKLGIGTLRVQAPGSGDEFFVVDGGFAQMSADTLTILTERAERASEIDAAGAAGELEQANADAIGGGIDRDEAEAAQARARSRLAAARG
ncbi:MAG: ATP synthase F1 subunit epsilon [Phycisphaerales bacterium]